jgi:serine/threonine protein kinase
MTHMLPQSSDGTTVVIKRTKKVFFDPSSAKCSLREIAIMRRLHHPNIVKILDILEPEDGTPPAAAGTAAAPDGGGGPNVMFKNLYVVLEDGGMDLKKFLESSKELTDEQIRHISRQICCAVAYLHSCRVVHRDLKPANILIDPSTLRVRVADFGLSRSVELPEGTVMTPPCPHSPPAPPSPRAICKSRSEADFLSRFAESDVRTVAGEDGPHACVQLSLEHMDLGDDLSLERTSLGDDFQMRGAGAM